MYKKLEIAAASLAAAGTVIAGVLDGLDVVDSLLIVLEQRGVTGGTLDLFLQVAPKEADVWVDYLRPAQLADGAAAVTRAYAVTRHAQQLTVATTDIGDTPSMAAGIIGGDFGERIRVVHVVGAGASVGAAQTVHLIGSETKRRN